MCIPYPYKYPNAQLEGSPCPSSAIHRPIPFQGGERREKGSHNRLGEGGNGQDGSIHVLLEGKNILSLLGGRGFQNGCGND
jgi:hypothetical protein